MCRALLLAVALCWAAAAHAADLVVQRVGRPVNALTAAALAALPSFAQRLPAPSSAHGMAENEWSGPKLWDVLAAAGAVDLAQHAEHVRLVAKVKGADGYVAAIAVGEISPEFGGRPVQLADHRDGKPLETLRLVVPGEKRGGRSVRDVVRIDVE